MSAASCLAEGFLRREWGDFHEPPIRGWELARAIGKHPNVKVATFTQEVSRILFTDGSVITARYGNVQWQPPGTACEVCGAPATMAVQDAQQGPTFTPAGDPVMRCAEHPAEPGVRHG